jgi:glycosyl transferase, family 25
MPTQIHDAPSAKNQFDTLFECYVINLQRQPEKLDVFRKQNAMSGINFHRFEAIDGTLKNTADTDPSFTAHGATYKSGFVGSAKSHLALWRRCAAESKRFVIFEDDAIVRNDLKARLVSVIGQVDDWDIILLGYNTDAPLELFIAPGIMMGGGFSVKYPTADHLSDFAASNNPVGLHRLNLAMGICGYALTPKGAQTLIHHCFPLDNRLVHYASLNFTFPAYGLDCIMATVYPKILAFACIAPLVMVANDKRTSTNV